MSRAEGRKLFVMVAVLLVMIGYLFQSSFKVPVEGETGIPVRAAPPIGHAGPYQDAAKALDTLRAQERADEAKRRGVSEIPSVQAEYRFDQAVLDRVEDYGLDVVEETGLYHLAAHMRRQSDEELAKSAKDEPWDWTALRTPEGRKASRGKVRTLQGRFLIPLWQRVLERYPNEIGVAWVWQGIFRVQNRGYYVTITDKTFEPEIGPSGTIIEFEAAFLKGHAYDTEQGIKRFPHVVVKKMRKVAPRPEWDYMNSEIVWGAMLAFVVGGFLVFLYARGSAKSGKEFDAWRHKRLTSKKAGTPKGGEPAGAGPPAEPESPPAAEPASPPPAEAEAPPAAAVVEPEAPAAAAVVEPEAPAAAEAEQPPSADEPEPVNDAPGPEADEAVVADAPSTDAPSTDAPPA
jgi:hypothetical protein